MRYPALFLGVVLLSLVYRLGRDLGLGSAGAVLAALWLGFSPQFTVHIREARMYGPMLVSFAAAAAAGLRFERLLRSAALWIAAAASLVSLLTQYFNILFVAGLSLWGVVELRGSARRRWVVAQTLALWLPLMGRGFFNPTSLSTGKAWSYTLRSWETLARLGMVAVYGYRDYTGAWLAGAGVALLALGWLAAVFRGRGWTRRFLPMLVAAPLGTYALLGWLKPVFHPSE